MTTPDVYRDAEYITNVSGIQHDSPSLDPDDERIKKIQSAAKVAFIDRLLRDLDILIYCELSALYYMDCSVILFAVRAIVQLIFFTPKASPFDPTRNQPFIGAIFASNLFCMVFHNFITHPEAGEETRGYLHGGMFIDFIGQKAPVSVFRLLSLDVLILVIDFVMLGLVIERVKASGASSATDGDTEARDPDRSQDHDAEERGVLRRSTSGDADAAPPHPPLPGEDGVELDDLGPGAARNSLDERLERTGLLGDSGEGRAKDGHFLDSFAGGEAVIMDMGLLDVIRDQWRYSPTGALRRSSPYLPSAETATFLRERFGLRVRPDGRFERVEQ